MKEGAALLFRERPLLGIRAHLRLLVTGAAELGGRCRPQAVGLPAQALASRAGARTSAGIHVVREKPYGVRRLGFPAFGCAEVDALAAHEPSRHKPTTLHALPLQPLASVTVTV